MNNRWKNFKSRWAKWAKSHLKTCKWYPREWRTWVRRRMQRWRLCRSCNNRFRVTLRTSKSKLKKLSARRWIWLSQLSNSKSKTGDQIQFLRINHPRKRMRRFYRKKTKNNKKTSLLKLANNFLSSLLNKCVIKVKLRQLFLLLKRKRLKMNLVIKRKRKLKKFKPFQLLNQIRIINLGQLIKSNRSLRRKVYWLTSLKPHLLKSNLSLNPWFLIILIKRKEERILKKKPHLQYSRMSWPLSRNQQIKSIHFSKLKTQVLQIKIRSYSNNDHHQILTSPKLNKPISRKFLNSLPPSSSRSRS